MCYPDRDAEVSETKGRLWPPILILILMFAFGTAVYSMSMNTPALDTPWFSIRDGALYFDGSQYTGGPELEVPATVDGQTVTALGDYCFFDCDKLSTVTLPDTVETIGICAFYDCDWLRGIKGPEALRIIGSEAFYSCGSLEAIYIPGSVASIGEDAFDECKALRHIFYGSQRQEWASLYPEKINEKAQIYVIDPSSPDGFRTP